MKSTVFIDCEIRNDGSVSDLGAVKENESFHSANKLEFANFVKSANFVCGHNIFRHDLKYIGNLFDQEKVVFIDTLCKHTFGFGCGPGRIDCFRIERN